MTNKPIAYEEDLDIQFGYWNAQIGLLKAGADRAKTEAKITYYKTNKAFYAAASKFI